MGTKIGKIDAFQGLRAVAFLGIFISHTALGNFACLGAWGVSVFFIMSGFLMMLSNLNKQEQPQFGYRFAWKKIRSLYPLHIVMMLLFAVYVMENGNGIIKTVIDIGIHSFLVQMWIPNTVYYTTLNGPAWYLCTSFFLYLCFPLILKLIRKCFNKRRACIALAGLVATQIMVSALAYFCTSPDSYAWFNTQWLVYYFPPARLIDFAIGCVLGYLFCIKNQECEDVKKSPKLLIVFLELIACFVIMVSLFIYANDYGILGSKAVKYALLFMPANAGIIWLIASRAGILHWLLSNKVLVMLGNISPYTFLIHMVALRYCGLLFSILGYQNVIITTLTAFALTIIGSVAWKSFWKNIKQG